MKHFVVGTMGKVGTTALQQSLKRHEEVRAYKTHLLTPESLRRAAKDRKNATRTPRWILEFSNFIQKHGLSGKNIVIVTPVREIIGRNISGFFQRLKEFGINPPYEDVDIDLTIEKFRKDFNHMRPDNWFRNEYEPAIGVSLDSIEFDPVKGYAVETINDINILLLQIEVGEVLMNEIFLEHYGIDLNLGRRNDSSNKAYAGLIAAFKARFVLDDELCDMLMGTEYMQKFYSAAQREHVADFYRKKVPSLLPLPR